MRSEQTDQINVSVDKKRKRYTRTETAKQDVTMAVPLDNWKPNLLSCKHAMLGLKGDRMEW